MRIRRISAIALSNRDFASFEEKLSEACRWVSLAAKTGSRLAVLPEAINVYRGDGPGNPRAMTVAESALDDWRNSCAMLLDCAVTNRIAVTIPLYIREGDGFLNCFFLISSAGEVLGRHVKAFPTPEELAANVAPAVENSPIEWDGVKVGGAICFDMDFPTVFEDQRKKGAEIFLCPSLSPGGDQLNHYAASLQRPIVLAYPAWSRIIDVLGREVAAGGYRHETLRFGFGVPVYSADVNFDKAVFHFDGNIQKYEAILRRYGTMVRAEFDQQNVRFSLESVSPDVTVQQIIEAFSLEPIQEYLVRASEECRAQRARRHSDA